MDENNELPVFKPQQNENGEYEAEIKILPDVHAGSSMSLKEAAAQDLKSIAIGDTVIWTRPLGVSSSAQSTAKCPVCDEKVNLVIEYSDGCQTIKKPVSVTFDFYTTQVLPLIKKYGRN